jgi:hypothetical protein
LGDFEAAALQADRFSVEKKSTGSIRIVGLQADTLVVAIGSTGGVEMLQGEDRRQGATIRGSGTTLGGPA